MMYMPLNYNQINLMAGSTHPASVKSFNNISFSFWQRSLYQRMASVLEFEGLPEGWKGKNKDFLIWCLFYFGFVGVFKKDELGTVFNPCTLNGYNFYYQPTEFVVTNPTIPTGSQRFTIGEDGELLKLTPDYLGTFDIVNYYAEKLSTLDGAINMSLINNKFAYVLGAKNKSASAAIKTIFDRINSGEPTVIYDNLIQDMGKDHENPFQFLERPNLKQSYLTTDQLNDFQTLINNFDAEIGIPTIPNEKKERMVTSEADSRKIDSISRSTVWLETLQESLVDVNRLIDGNITVSLRFADTGTEEPVEDEEDEENGM